MKPTTNGTKANQTNTTFNGIPFKQTNANALNPLHIGDTISNKLPALDVWPKIVKEIGGRNILKARMRVSFYGFDNHDQVSEDTATEAEGLTLLKNSKHALIVKRGEYVFFKIDLDEVEEIELVKTGKRERVDLYTLKIKADAFYLIDLDISSRTYRDFEYRYR